MHREFASASVDVNAATPESIRSVTFYCGTRTVRREIRGVVFTERIRDYLRFDFPFGIEGTRGEPHPPASPEPEEF